ncbi:AAA domain-containing protein [Rhizobiales bacterium Sp-1]|uniref:AAA domain-containing protein n=2 Tax=Segnochrobactrum spirostomi TaxID=2608987 RepID=A0A6A7YC74_9HYPH|nr:AAA domain-containing protein [Segnochrobactrum spirostomi]
MNSIRPSAYVQPSVRTSAADFAGRSDPRGGADLHDVFARLGAYMNACILGQPEFVDRLLIAVIADGHLLVEGAPGLAKTKAVKALSKAIRCDDQRIQFTPDLLPSDLTGTDIYRPEDGSFRFQAGPIFHNLVLADEINRAPAKVQAALLEAMAERQVTVGGVTYALPEFFLVMATQNPIEQEGTYALPEAQLDRFLLHVKIGYPDLAAEREILRLVRGEAQGEVVPFGEPVAQETIFAARRAALSTYMSEAVEEYILQLVFATRLPEHYGKDLAGTVSFGASPRGTIALDRCARAHAWLHGRDFVVPEDVQAIAKDVLRHRVLLTFEAEADGLNADHFLDLLLGRVPVG